MNHVAGLLSAYVDGQATPTERRLVEEHLDECEQCRAELRDIRTIKAALARLPSYAPARSFVIGPRAARPAALQGGLPGVARALTSIAAGLAVLAVSASLALNGVPRQETGPAPAAAPGQAVPPAAAARTLSPAGAPAQAARPAPAAARSSVAAEAAGPAAAAPDRSVAAQASAQAAGPAAAPDRPSVAAQAPAQAAGPAAAPDRPSVAAQAPAQAAGPAAQQAPGREAGSPAAGKLSGAAATAERSGPAAGKAGLPGASPAAVTSGQPPVDAAALAIQIGVLVLGLGIGLYSVRWWRT